MTFSAFDNLSGDENLPSTVVLSPASSRHWSPHEDSSQSNWPIDCTFFPFDSNIILGVKRPASTSPHSDKRRRLNGGEAETETPTECENPHILPCIIYLTSQILYYEMTSCHSARKYTLSMPTSARKFALCMIGFPLLLLWLWKSRKCWLRDSILCHSEAWSWTDGRVCDSHSCAKCGVLVLMTVLLYA